jgi:hypothetical protein
MTRRRVFSADKVTQVARRVRQIWKPGSHEKKLKFIRICSLPGFQIPFQSQRFPCIVVRIAHCRRNVSVIERLSCPTLIASYKDRKTGLIVFGVLTIGMGVIIGMFVPLMIFSAAMSAKEPGLEHATKAFIPAAGIYGLLAIVLISLGIGSTMARRWARALLLIFSWSWLVMGVIAIANMAFIVPRVFSSTAFQRPGQAPVSSSTQSLILGIVLTFYSVILVVLPVIWLCFYQSKNVKATCEARDPVSRWTDRCPLPVLFVSVWSTVGSLVMLTLPFACGGIFPFFGTFLSGNAGTMAYILLAVVWIYAAWSVFKLELRGWWLIVIAICLFSISNVLTYSYHDIREMYQLMGYPEKQIAIIEQLGLFNRKTMIWWCLIWTVPFFAYLFFIRRYFRRA